ncbi:MAG: MBL fold metallo-hydrolase [Prevotella sp.]|nr:MBL fold metallo-hydrolase [Prevotella sp.]
MRKIAALLALTLLTATACQAQYKTDEFKTQSGKTVKITFIKHASIQISYRGLEFYADPVYEFQPRTDFTRFPKANFILVTHEHRDHYDKEALAQLKTPATTLYLNQSVYNDYRHGQVVANGDSLSIDTDIQLQVVPAYNTTPGREQMHPKGRDNGYILTLDGLRIYIAGDTEDIPEMANLDPIDIAFLPCNQPYTMTPQQLERAARIIKPRVLYPYHYSETPIRQIPLLLAGSGIDVRIRDMK